MGKVAVQLAMFLGFVSCTLVIIGMALCQLNQGEGFLLKLDFCFRYIYLWKTRVTCNSGFEMTNLTKDTFYKIDEGLNKVQGWEKCVSLL